MTEQKKEILRDFEGGIKDLEKDEIKKIEDQMKHEIGLTESKFLEKIITLEDTSKNLTGKIEKNNEKIKNLTDKLEKLEKPGVKLSLDERVNNINQKNELNKEISALYKENKQFKSSIGNLSSEIDKLKKIKELEISNIKNTYGVKADMAKSTLDSLVVDVNNAVKSNDIKDSLENIKHDLDSNLIDNLKENYIDSVRSEALIKKDYNQKQSELTNCAENAIGDYRVCLEDRVKEALKTASDKTTLKNDREVKNIERNI